MSFITTPTLLARQYNYNTQDVTKFKKVTIDTISVTSTFQSTGSFKKAVLEFLEKHPGITSGTITIQKSTKTWYVNDDEIRFI